MKELLDIFVSTWQDQEFSRAEKQAVKQLIDDNVLDKHSKAWLRSQVFDFALQQANTHNARKVIAWLEVANKCLLDEHEKAISSAEESKAYFSPGEECRNAILKHLKSAQKSIDICVFTITDNSISSTILEAHRKGIKIRILTDNDKEWDLGSDIEEFKAKNVPVKSDFSEAHMHHKFAIIDLETLINGSFNWTISATQNNQENLVISRDKILVKQFQDEFERLWKRF